MSDSEKMMVVVGEGENPHEGREGVVPPKKGKKTKKPKSSDDADGADEASKEAKRAAKEAAKMRMAEEKEAKKVAAEAALAAEAETVPMNRTDIGKLKKEGLLELLKEHVDNMREAGVDVEDLRTKTKPELQRALADHLFPKPESSNQKKSTTQTLEEILIHLEAQDAQMKNIQGVLMEMKSKIDGLSIQVKDGDESEVEN